MARPKIGPVTRYVRTPEGSDFYGVPIGSPISPDLIKKKNREAASLGLVPPKGAVQDASGQIDRSAEQARPVPKVGAPKADGPQKFKVGANEYGVPEGSRIFQPKGKPGMRYIMEPDGTIRAFNEQGEAEVPESLADKLRDLLESDDRYEEVEFDSIPEPAAEPTPEPEASSKISAPEPAEAPTPSEGPREESAGASEVPETVEEMEGYLSDDEIERRIRAASIDLGSSALDRLEERLLKSNEMIRRRWERMREAAAVAEFDDSITAVATPGRWLTGAVSIRPGTTVSDQTRADVPGAFFSTDRRWALVKNGIDVNNKRGGYSIYHVPTGLIVRPVETKQEGTKYATALATLGPLSIDEPGVDHTLKEHKPDILRIKDVIFGIVTGKPDAGAGAKQEPPARPDLQPGDAATADFIRGAAAGDQVTYYPTTAGLVSTDWTKQADGSWTNSSGGSLDEQEMISSLADNVLVTSPGKVSAERFYPGAPEMDRADLQAAYDSLNAHPGFQIAYGLPQGSPLRDREVIGAMTTAARAKYPDVSPKQAVLAHMRDFLGIQDEAPEDAPETDGPQITVGAAEPKRTGVQGMNGGSFSRADIAEAVDILEQFQGKAFKSELNKKGNALGVLDPSSIVGIEKDKTIAKQKFVDYLKGILAANPEEAPETDPDSDDQSNPFGITDADREASSGQPAGTMNALPEFQATLRQARQIAVGTSFENHPSFENQPLSYVAFLMERSGLRGEARQVQELEDRFEEWRVAKFVTPRPDPNNPFGVTDEDRAAAASAPAGTMNALPEFQATRRQARALAAGTPFESAPMWDNQPLSYVAFIIDSSRAHPGYKDLAAKIQEIEDRFEAWRVPRFVPPRPTVRTPEELVGQSPETLAEVQSLPVGARVQFLGVTYVRTEDGPWQALNWTAQDYTTFTDEELAGALRGVTVLRVDTPLDEYVTRVPNGSIGFLRVGESIVARNSMSTQVWTRSPDEDGVRVWRDLAGNANYEDNMPEVLLGFQESFQESTLWYLRRDPQAPENAPAPFAGWGGDSSIPLPPPPNSIEATNVPNRFNVGDLPNAQWMRMAPLGSAIWKSGDPTSTRARAHTWVRVSEDEWTNEEGTARSAWEFPSSEFSGIDKILRVGTGESQDSEETPDPEETPQASSADQFAEPTGPWEWASTGGSGGLRYMVIRKVKNHPSGNSTIYDQTSNGNERMFRSPEAAIARAEALNALPDNQGVFFRVLDPSDFITDRTEAGDQIVLRSDGADAMTYTRGVPDSDGGVPWTDSTGGVHYATDLPEAFSLDVEGIEGRATWHVRRAEETSTFPGTGFPNPPESVPYAVGTDRVGGRPSVDFIRGGAAPGSAVRLRARAFLNQPEDAILVRTNDGEWVDANGRVFDQYNLGAVTIRSDTTILRIGDGSPEPEPEEIPEPEILEFAQGQEVTGADLRNMANGTRLVYNRKDGKQTFYTVQRDELVIVTDRGTEVDFSRAERMPFTVVEVPGDSTPQPDPSNDTEAFPNEGDYIETLRELRTVETGSMFKIGAVVYMKVSDDRWLSSFDNEEYSVRDFRFRLQAGKWVTVERNPIPENELPWFSPPDNPDWEPIPLQPGDEIPRVNLDDALDALPEDTFIQFTANRVSVTARKTADGTWALTNDNTAVSGFSSGSVETLANQSRSPIVVTALPVERAPEGGDAEPLDAEAVRRLQIGAVVEVRTPGRPPYKARRDDRGWVLNVPTQSGTSTEVLSRYAAAGDVFLSSGDFERPFVLTTVEQVDNLPVGSIARAGDSGPRIKNDLGEWEGIARTSSPVDVRAFFAKGAVFGRNAEVEVLYNPYESRDLPDGYETLNAAEAFSLPPGSIVEGLVGDSRMLRKSDGTWSDIGPLAYSKNNAEFLQPFSGGIRVLRNGLPEFDREPVEGQRILPEQIMALPVGSRFEVSTRRSGTLPSDGVFNDEASIYVKVGPDHVLRVNEANEDPFDVGRNPIAILKYDRGVSDQQVVYAGVDDRISDAPTIGSSVVTLDQLKQVPLGAILTTRTGSGFNISVVKVEDDMYVSSRDQFDWREDFTFSAESFFTERSTPLVYSGNAIEGKSTVTSADPAVRNAAPGTILVSTDELTSAMTRTEGGQWVDSSGEFLEDSDIAGQDYFLIPPPKETKRPQPASVFAAAGALPGTVVELTLPSALKGSPKKRSFRWTGEDWEALDANVPTTLPRSAIIAAAGRGAVKITAKPATKPADYAELRARIMDAKTPAEVTVLIQTYHPDVNWKPWDFTKGVKLADRAKRLENYKQYMAGAARMFEEYPEAKGIGSVSGETSGSSGFAWVNHPRIEGRGSDLAASSLKFHMGSVGDRVVAGYQNGIRNNHFHGTARPGITEQERIVIHEFGHVLDTMTGMVLGDAAQKAFKEYIGRFPEGAERNSVIEQSSSYSRTNKYETVAETFENWSTNVEVEPLTEFIMEAITKKFREETGLTDFEFKKHPGYEGAEPNVDLSPAPIENQTHSLGSATARVGEVLTEAEANEVPVYTVVEVEGAEWYKMEGNFWRRGSGPVSTTAEAFAIGNLLGGMRLRTLPQAGAYSQAALEYADTGTTITVESQFATITHRKRGSGPTGSWETVGLSGPRTSATVIFNSIKKAADDGKTITMSPQSSQAAPRVSQSKVGKPVTAELIELLPESSWISAPDQPRGWMLSNGQWVAMGAGSSERLSATEMWEVLRNREAIIRRVGPYGEMGRPANQ